MLRGKSIFYFLLVVISFVSAFPSSRKTRTKNPIIDLQYALHQGKLDESGTYYSFSNIRYAAPPIGNLRFAAPVTPVVNRTLKYGHENSICAQGSPLWNNLMMRFLMGEDTEQLKKDEEELEFLKSSLTLDTIYNYQPSDSRTSEDCLLLDVIVSEGIFNGNKSAPVLVWIYGGGYVTGDKTSAGNPINLLDKANKNGRGIIFVAINYRLGLFGWLSGPSFVSQGGLPNVGLHDQRFALEWVQKYIHLFGGDPSRVTVMGESAGGGSIMHHITAWGSKDAPPFQQAILQSPGFNPVLSDAQQEDVYQSIISQAQNLIRINITSIADLRSLDFKTLEGLNKILIAKSTYGSFLFGPVVDGTFVPKLPGTLMSEGRYAKSLKVMTAHNSDEGYIFTPPRIDDTTVNSKLQSIFAQASDKFKMYVIEKVWPAIYDGSLPYSNSFQRASVANAEIGFTCNARFTALAYPNSYSYIFSLAPGYHGIDVPYTFFDGKDRKINSTVAQTMQSLIINFAKNGNPNGPGVPRFPTYFPDSQMLELTDNSVDNVQIDPAANDRCTWLQNLSPIS